ncbi:MAG: peptidoglycan-binding domain-containing protein [Dermatophilus congolensis]|nr:peptidoglycan-binding domain-containing protein [Dermatophilus congolensis]
MRRSTAIALAVSCLLTAAPQSGALAASPDLDRGDSVDAEILDGPVLEERETVEIANALVPRAAVSLPKALDAKPRYNAQVSCDPVSRPGTSALGQLLVTTYKQGTAGYARSCSGGGTSEHYDGRAVDWMVNVNNPAQKAAGDAATAWLVANNGANARRLGVQYIIWNKRSWRAYAPERGWTAYTGASPHTDHVHLSLTWDGAMKRTSWWTGKAVAAQDLGPCPVYAGQPAPIYTGIRTGVCPAPKAAPKTAYKTWVLGQKNAQIATAQRLLGVASNGSFGSSTRTAVIKYQRTSKLPITGVLDAATWVKLTGRAAVNAPVPGSVSAPVAPRTSAPPTIAAVVVATPLTAYKRAGLRPGSTGAGVRAVQRALGVPVTGRYDAATTRAVVAVQKRWKIAQSGRVDARTWNRIELTRYPWLPYVGQKLQLGSRGPAVTALQRVLGVKADGVLGDRTAAVLRGTKKRLGLRPTGVVDTATWQAFTRLGR